MNDITVYTQSNSTYDPLAHVNLTFTCGIFTCEIGQTEFISFGAAAGLTARYPYCVSGILRGKRDGFETAQTFIQTETPGEYTLNLQAIREFSDYEVLKHDFDNPSSQFKLSEDEIASISSVMVKVGERMAEQAQGMKLSIKQWMLMRILLYMD
ncbi:hypothetical protein HYU19_06250 [Candidatus Woesearchaeota archaeon]|nr:hypothetical protein [Candidatus Woesearchaeota archaeon]